ncbi:peroxiredoxin [Salinibaculum salinum]|uniref:peroxiredoxin n=1 Tax=Salinibaculum salinum TaxID=3131996 RepID=UPI0030EF7561
MSLNSGDSAPSITASNQHGTERTITFNEPTVVYFYPADDTPGCTTEAVEFGKELQTYRDAGVSVYGVSVDDVDSHWAFADKHDIEFDLLADPDGEVAEVFDVERRGSGVTTRTTFVVVNGKIYDVYTDVDPKGHARDVLSALLEYGVVNLSE